MANTPLEVYHAFRAAMLSGTAAWQDLLAEQVTLQGPLAQSEGKEAFIAINTPFFQSIQTSELHTAVAVEDYVITQITTVVALPTGQQLQLEVSEWYQIQDGKIHSFRAYFDTAEFKKALGM